MATNSRELGFAIIKGEQLIKTGHQYEALQIYRKFDYAPGKQKMLQDALMAHSRGNYYMEEKTIADMAVELDDKQAMAEVVSWWMSPSPTDTTKLIWAYGLYVAHHVGEEYFSLDALTGLVKRRLVTYKVGASLTVLCSELLIAVTAANIAGSAIIRQNILESITAVHQDELKKMRLYTNETMILDALSYRLEAEASSIAEKVAFWPELQQEDKRKLKYLFAHCCIKRDGNKEEVNRKILKKLLPKREYGDYLMHILIEKNYNLLIEDIVTNFRRYGGFEDLIGLSQRCLNYNDEKKAREIFDEAYDLEVLRLQEKLMNL